MKIKNRSSADLEIIVTGIFRPKVKTSWISISYKQIDPKEELIIASRQPFLKNKNKAYHTDNIDYFEVQIFRKGFMDRKEIFNKGEIWVITDESFCPIIDSTQMSSPIIDSIQMSSPIIDSTQMLLAALFQFFIIMVMVFCDIFIRLL